MSIEGNITELPNGNDNLPAPVVGFEAARRAARARKSTIVNQTEDVTMMNASKPDFEKMTKDTASQGKDQMDAMMQSGTVLAKGAESLVKTCLGLAQESAEKSAEGIKALMACKTLNELTETQTRLAQDAFDQYMGNVTKLSEMTVKLATESFQPLNAQMSRSMQKAGDTVKNAAA